MTGVGGGSQGGWGAGYMRMTEAQVDVWEHNVNTYLADEEQDMCATPFYYQCKKRSPS